MINYICDDCNKVMKDQDDIRYFYAGERVSPFCAPDEDSLPPVEKHYCLACINKTIKAVDKLLGGKDEQTRNSSSEDNIIPIRQQAPK